MSHTDAPWNNTLYVSKIAASQITSGTWSQLMSYSDTSISYWKHSTGLFRDTKGHIVPGCIVSYATSNYLDEYGSSANGNINESQIYQVYLGF